MSSFFCPLFPTNVCSSVLPQLDECVLLLSLFFVRKVDLPGPQLVILIAFFGPANELALSGFDLSLSLEPHCNLVGLVEAEVGDAVLMKQLLPILFGQALLPTKLSAIVLVPNEPETFLPTF